MYASEALKYLGDQRMSIPKRDQCSAFSFSARGAASAEADPNLVSKRDLMRL